jgi:hypothetical protein
MEGKKKKQKQLLQHEADFSLLRPCFVDSSSEKEDPCVANLLCKYQHDSMVDESIITILVSQVWEKRDLLSLFFSLFGGYS